ncbi:hypothetical protein DFQ29_008858 [Apophysomyces sp. BC1021]|nr:hypothetical protein DFQ29_008858 [Apophysomyces sp. BC1021]
MVLGIASVILIVFITTPIGGQPAPRQKNVIMMISDGFGPASETFARQYHGWRENLVPRDNLLPLDTIHVGHSRTQSSSSLVTDSAAGATAFACALKSYNGAIGVDPDQLPCGTVLESAKIQHGMLTGLVATSRITHATPASFSAHVIDRNMENEIAVQQIGNLPLGRTVDLMFGGGLCEFLSNQTEGSCRTDDRDVLQEAKEEFGWNVYQSRAEFDALTATSAALPLMGLFAPQHMSYEMDRVPSEQPSLKEMTHKALSILGQATKDMDRGFFLMIEGSRIDMAAHTNDPAAHVHDIWQYHQTVEVVKKFVEEHPDTVVISTSDHETGGFTLGRQLSEAYPEYKWYGRRNPEVISRVQNSSEVLALSWSDAIQQDVATREYLENVLIRSGLGIDDPSEDEISRVFQWQGTNKTTEELAYLFSDMVSRRALIGWSTHGHTAVDVNLYAYGARADELRGSHENTEIGDFIVDYLDLDLQSITKKLNKNAVFSNWFKRTEMRTETKPHYHG